jgi:hypothetical protein
MTAITHPIVSTHHILTVMVTAVVTAGLTVTLMLALGTTTTAAPVTHLTRAADPTLCSAFANATPGSPAQFKLAEAVTAQGSC